MVNLNLNPEAILTLERGARCTLDGVEFEFQTYPEMGEGRVFLTSVDSQVDLYNNLCEKAGNDCANVPDYHKLIKHVRVGLHAVVARTRLHKALIENTYRIG